ncbi:hypothetical protein D3C86_1927690 [compost metagenome]
MQGLFDALHGFAERLQADVRKGPSALIRDHQHDDPAMVGQRAQQQVFAAEQRAQAARQQGRELGMVGGCQAQLCRLGQQFLQDTALADLQGQGRGFLGQANHLVDAQTGLAAIHHH